MMNTVRKSENLLPFPVISAAANGDTTAMCAILKHYEGYIAKLCTRTLKDDAGNTYSYVDEEMRIHSNPIRAIFCGIFPVENPG